VQDKIILAVYRRSILLSTLIPVRYEKSINTLHDAVVSGLPIVLAEGSGTYSTFRDDPRPDARKLFSKALSFQWNVKEKPSWVMEM
jgi:hypothetical protein